MKLTNQWIIDTINAITIEKMTKQIELAKKKEELQMSWIYLKVQQIESEIQELTTKDTEIKKQGKQILLDNNIKKFESIDGTVIQLNKLPWKLVIDKAVDPDLSEYEVEKTTTTVDKKKQLRQQQMKSAS